jgi:hypothetical protein
MRTTPLLIPLALCCTGCWIPSVAVQAGYTNLATSGSMALSTSGGSLGAQPQRDIGSSLGLGDHRGNVYARAELDIGSPVVTASAFQFDEQGSGILDGSYGAIPAGTQVYSDLSITNLKGSLTFEIGLGPVSVAPGLALDVFDMDMVVQDGIGNTEEVDVLAPIPMPVLRAEVDLGVIGAVGEVGYIDIPRIEDVEGRFWDAELLIEYRPAPLFFLFAGYRHISMDGRGETDGHEFGLDLELSGWMIGGGLSF